MAYITPSGIIQLFKNINLDNRYMHTYYFTDEADQSAFFDTKATQGLTFNRQSYSRASLNHVKVQLAPDTALGVCYMRFKNRSKWFYAFVTNTEYINENTTLIEFEIDVMQTWFIQNGTIEHCYVERNHVSSDDFGIYTAEESIAPTETYLHSVRDSISVFDTYNIVVETTNRPTDVGQSSFRENAYCGTTYFTAEESAAGATVMTNFLDSSLGMWDESRQKVEIVDLYSFPQHFCHANIVDNVYTMQADVPTGFNYDGVVYTPHNKRLLNYPYSYAILSDNNGGATVLKWELFKDAATNGANFVCKGTSMGGGSIMCYPVNYDGLTNNYDCSLVMNNFPKRSFAFDAYQAWIASGGQTKTNASWDIAKLGIANGVIETGQMSVQAAADIVGGSHSINEALTNQGFVARSIMGGYAPSNASQLEADNLNQAGGGLRQVGRGINKGIDALQQGISTYATYKEAKNKRDFAFKDALYQPNYVVGKSTSDLMVANRQLYFRVLACFPAYTEAIRIDDFFSIYGYAIKKVTTPTLMCRKYWTFVKTQCCQISGEMPASSKEAIAKIFDGGIFFWRKSATIGKFDAEITNGAINNPIQV